MLDLGGNIGLSNYVLKTMAHKMSNSTSLHSLLLENANLSLTATGIINFAEIRWRWLKRLHIRNCGGCVFDIVQENYLTKSLEIEVILDGARMGARSLAIAQHLVV